MYFTLHPPLGGRSIAHKILPCKRQLQTSIPAIPYLPISTFHERMFRISRQFHWKTAPKISHRQFSSFRYASKMDLPRPFLEEETLDCYSPDQFYPVAVGEVLNSSYKVVGKLGYGAQSTVWLCRDIRYDC